MSTPKRPRGRTYGPAWIFVALWFLLGAATIAAGLSMTFDAHQDLQNGIPLLVIGAFPLMLAYHGLAWRRITPGGLEVQRLLDKRWIAWGDIREVRRVGLRGIGDLRLLDAKGELLDSPDYLVAGHRHLNMRILREVRRAQRLARAGAVA